MKARLFSKRTHIHAIAIILCIYCKIQICLNRKVKHMLQERQQQVIDPHAAILQKLHQELVFVKAKLKNVQTNVKTIIVCD